MWLDSRVTNRIFFRRLFPLSGFRLWWRLRPILSLLMMLLLPLFLIAPTSALSLNIRHHVLFFLVPLCYHGPSFLRCLPFELTRRWRIFIFHMFFVFSFLFMMRVTSGPGVRTSTRFLLFWWFHLFFVSLSSISTKYNIISFTIFSALCIRDALDTWGVYNPWWGHGWYASGA